MKKFYFFIISIFVLSVLILFYFSLGVDRSYNTQNLVGKKITEINLKSFKGNKIFNTADFSNNNFTLINFWASWCAPCRKEHRFLMELSKNENLKIIGVNFKDSHTNAEKFLDNLGNPYDLLLKDRTGKKSIEFGVYGIPETILIDSELIIIKKYIGAIKQKDIKTILTLIEGK